MFNFDAFVSAVKTSLESYLMGEIKEHAGDVMAEVQTFLDETKSDLKQWTEYLAAGKMSKEDYASLLRGQVGLAKLVALKRLGSAQARLDEIRNGIANIIIDTAFNHIL